MKTAIVTGGTKGIGLSISKMLLKEGYYVYATFANDTEGAKNAHGEFLNVSNEFSIEQVDQSDSKNIHHFVNSLMFNQVRIDCIICNAGNTLRKSIVETTDAEWEKVFQTNVHSHFYLIRDLWNNINPNSRIVFIGSMMAVYPHSVSLAYGVTKSAIHSMAVNLVKSFEGTGTTVNVIAPGFVDTNWQKNKPQTIRDRICSKTAIHRFASSDEIAGAVQFCLNNPYVNGSIIEISGGYCYE